MMCELVNAVLAERSSSCSTGFSIGSNDLTQLTPASTAIPGWWRRA